MSKIKAVTRGEMLGFLTSEAKRYRQEALASIERNGHMNDLSGKNIQHLKKRPKLTKRLIEALLVDFINEIEAAWCVDYALHTRHLDDHQPEEGV